MIKRSVQVCAMKYIFMYKYNVLVYNLGMHICSKYEHLVLIPRIIPRCSVCILFNLVSNTSCNLLFVFSGNIPVFILKLVYVYMCICMPSVDAFHISDSKGSTSRNEFEEGSRKLQKVDLIRFDFSKIMQL